MTLGTAPQAAGSSFLSMDNLGLTFGRVRQESADIEVAWPSGLTEVFLNQPSGRMVTLVEGSGILR